MKTLLLLLTAATLLGVDDLSTYVQTLEWPPNSGLKRTLDDPGFHLELPEPIDPPQGTDFPFEEPDLTESLHLTNATDITVYDGSISMTLKTIIYTNITWYVTEDAVANLGIATVQSTNWTTIKEINDKTPGNLTVLTYDQIKQVGWIETNRVMLIAYKGRTNEIILDKLGREEWPSQKRVQLVPARFRP